MIEETKACKPSRLTIVVVEPEEIGVGQAYEQGARKEEGHSIRNGPWRR
jgi:hypothetical protein